MPESRVGEWTLVRVLGAGAAGEVWEARGSDGALVALKLYRAELAAVPQLRRWMQAEVRATARLSHPNIVRVLEQGEHPDTGAPYVVLEHCAGGSLDRRRPTSWPELRDVVAQLLGALAHAHARGLLHRDLKPANVLWATSDPGSPVRLADFGVAHVVGTARGRRSVTGSPAYMAPEQAAGVFGRQGPWTDLWALGVLVYALVFGILPFPTPDGAPLPRFDRSSRFPVPPRLVDWLERLWAAEPEDRPRDAPAAWRALRTVDPTVPAPRSTWREPPGWDARPAPGLLGLVTGRTEGREAEQERAWALLERVRDTARPEVLLVSGVSGIGKTHLLRWLSEQVVETGLGGASRVDGSAADGGLAELLVGLLRLHDVRAEDRPRALRDACVRLRLDPAVIEVLSGWSQAAPVGWGASPAVRALVARVAERAGAWVLVLDEGQAGDELRQLARSLLADPAEAPVLVGLGVQTPAPGALHGLVGRDGVTHLELQTLADPAIDALVRGRIGLDSDARALLTAEAGGHPGRALRLFEAWHGAGAVGLDHGALVLVRAPPPVAPAEEWRAVVGAVADRSSPSGLAAMERAAAQGVDVDEELWHASCDDVGSDGALAPAELKRRLQTLGLFLDADLCRDTDQGFRFVHPGVVDALLDRARAGGRDRTHHLACANQLRGADGLSPARSLELGRHLVAAGRAEEAVGPLARALDPAGELPARTLARAVALLDEAVTLAELPAAHPARVRLLDAWAVHHLQLGRTGQAGTFAEAALRQVDADPAADPAILARALMRCVDIAFFASRGAEALPHLLRLEPLLHLVPPRNRVLHLGRLGSVLGGEAGAARFAEAERLAASERMDAALAGSVVELASWRDDAARLVVVAEAAIVVARREGALGTALFASTKRLEGLKTLGRFDEAEAELDRAGRLALELGRLRTVLLLAAQRVSLACDRADHPGVIEAADAALTLATDVDEPWLTGMILVMKCDGLISSGALDRLDGVLDRLALLAPRIPRSSEEFHPSLAQLASRLSPLHPALGARLARLAEGGA